MATSSFSKTFIFDSDTTKKIREIQKKPGIYVSASFPNRIEEGKKALAHFSSHLKK